ncbi:hypothetical protein ACFQX7_25395 [Luedemannella flava]
MLFLLCGGGSAAAVWTWQGLEHNTAGKVDFVRPLAVPALAPSRLDERGRRVFELTARRGRHDFGNGPVATWGSTATTSGRRCAPSAARRSSSTSTTD